MVKSPEERENSLRRSLSQSDGDTPRGLDANSEVQQRAMQRYHRLLKTDRQLQVLHMTKLQPLLSLTRVPANALMAAMVDSTRHCMQICTPSRRLIRLSGKSSMCAKEI